MDKKNRLIIKIFCLLNNFKPKPTWFTITQKCRNKTVTKNIRLFREKSHKIPGKQKINRYIGGRPKKKENGKRKQGSKKI